MTGGEKSDGTKESRKGRERELGWGRIWAELFPMEVRNVITENTFQKILERCERVSYMGIWEKSLGDRGKSVCKDPEVERCLAFSRNIQEFSVAGPE